MEIDNFEQLSLFIERSHLSPNEFFFVQILIRGKDGHSEKGKNGNNKNRLIKFYCIKNKEALLEKKDEIISICKLFNARAYIHPTPRNFKEVADKVLEIFPTIYLSNTEGLKGIYSTACGKSYVSKRKLFIVDLDGEDVNKIDEISNFIQNCEPIDLETSKIIQVVPTLHGKHLITRPFNTAKFKDQYTTIDVHKNNPTLLYYNEPIK